MTSVNTSTRGRIRAQLDKLSNDRQPWHGYVAFKKDGQWTSPHDTAPPLTLDDATDKLAEGIANGWDCYLTLASFKPASPCRKLDDAPGQFGYSRVVWADYDAADKHGKPNPIVFPMHLFDRKDDRCIRELADATQIVASGRAGHYQPRIHLMKAIKQESLERLNHAFMMLVGGDTKWRANSYLRLPGSPNSRDGAVKAKTIQQAVAPLRAGEVKHLLSKAFAEVGREYDWNSPLKSTTPHKGELEFVPLANKRRREILRKLGKDPYARKLETSAKLGTRHYIEAYQGDMSTVFMGFYRDLHRVGVGINEAYSFLEPLSDPFVDGNGRPKLERHIRSQWPNDEPAPRSTVDKKDVRRPLKLESAAGIKMKRVKWLWHHRIPLGGLSLIGGREGTGKSTVMIDLMAKVTRGLLEGELSGKPRDVIYMTTEDSWESTIVPRLTAANADLPRVHRIRPVKDEESLVNFHDDLATLQELVVNHQIALVAVDPILSVLGDDVDDTKGKELRKSLEAVNRMANETECAVLGVIHFNKRDSDDVGMLFSGNLVWSQVARATLAVVPHPDRQDRKNSFILDRGKNNLAPAVPALEGTIKSKFLPSEDGQIETSYIDGLIESEFDLREAIRPDVSAKKNDRLGDWLVELLTSRGEVPKKEIVERAKGIHSVSESTLDRHFKRLHGQSRQEGFGKDKVTYWSLPGYTSNVEDLR